MSKFLSVLAVVAMMAVAGCNRNSDMAAGTAEGESRDAALTDACAHCAGVQKATADGKCPVCEMPAARAK